MTYNFINPFRRETKCPKRSFLSKSFSVTLTATKPAYLIYTCALPKPVWIERTEIQNFTRSLDYETFKEDVKAVRAVEMNFIIIGEAANQIPEEIEEKYSVYLYGIIFLLGLDAHLHCAQAQVCVSTTANL